jgi:hypothetical protein
MFCREKKKNILENLRIPAFVAQKRHKKVCAVWKKPLKCSCPTRFLNFPDNLSKVYTQLIVFSSIAAALATVYNKRKRKFYFNSMLHINIL